MKILRITPNIPYGGPYTVDRTDIKVDSTSITTDKTIDDMTMVNLLTIIPSVTNATYSISIINEFTKVKEIYNVNSFITNGLTNILIPDLTSKEGDRLEIEVYNGLKRVWRGKALVTDKDDIQNYQLTDTTNNKIRF